MVRSGTWLFQAVDRIAAAEVPPEELEAKVARSGVGPVFTAHPTEAARRTMLAKLRQVGDVLGRRDAAHSRRRLKELIDLIWQTDELRIARPDVLDEARNAVYYLDELHGDAVPHVLEELTAQLGRLGLALPVTAGRWPSTAGSAATVTTTRTSAPTAPRRWSRATGGSTPRSRTGSAHLHARQARQYRRSRASGRASSPPSPRSARRTSATAQR